MTNFKSGCYSLQHTIEVTEAFYSSILNQEVVPEDLLAACRLYLQQLRQLTDTVVRGLPTFKAPSGVRWSEETARYYDEFY